MMAVEVETDPTFRVGTLELLVEAPSYPDGIGAPPTGMLLLMAGSSVLASLNHPSIGSIPGPMRSRRCWPSRDEDRHRYPKAL